jgi:hypothetical protein
MLKDVLWVESIGGSGIVRARLRMLGRGMGASKGESPRARRANSWIPGLPRNVDVQWSS